MDWINPLIKKENIDCVLFLGDAVENPEPPEESVKILSKIECKRMLAIQGNIDSPKLPECFGDVAENMHGIGKQVGDVYIAGFGGSNPTIFDTPCEFSEEEILSRLDAISKEGSLRQECSPATVLTMKICFILVSKFLQKYGNNYKTPNNFLETSKH